MLADVASLTRIAMTSRIDAAEEQWTRLMGGQKPSQVMSVPASSQNQTPGELKADQRTRLVRDMTDEAAEQRLAKVARLRQARLDKEAHDKAQAILAAGATKPRNGSAA